MLTMADSVSVSDGATDDGVGVAVVMAVRFGLACVSQKLTPDTISSFATLHFIVQRMTLSSTSTMERRMAFLELVCLRDTL